MILNDAEIEDLIKHPQSPFLTNFDAPGDWKGKDSLVQPSSLDLHIGQIFRPGVGPGKSGSAGNPKSELVLHTGETAIVETKETLNVPSDHAAFGFPPSHVSSRALLMTNPGHVDPGYRGTLRFTVINMGRENYVLRSGDPVVTLLIFRLSLRANADYSVRRSGSLPSNITQNQIDILSPDFVDVSKRAASIAKKTLGFATVGASVLAAIVAWAVNAIDKRIEGIDELRTKVTHLEDQNTYLASELSNSRSQIDRQIDLAQRVANIESTINRKERTK